MFCNLKTFTMYKKQLVKWYIAAALIQHWTHDTLW